MFERKVSQNALLNNFDLFIQLMNKMKPEMISNYSLPTRFENANGMCFGLAMSRINADTFPAIDQASQTKFSRQELIKVISLLNKKELTHLVSEGSLRKFGTLIVLEDVIMIFKSLTVWQNMHHYGSHQRLYGKAISQRMLTWKASDELFLSLEERLKKLINVDPNRDGIWSISMRYFFSGAHALNIQRKGNQYFIFDSNVDVAGSIGPFKTLKGVADFLTETYGFVRLYKFSSFRLVPFNEFEVKIRKLSDEYKNKNLPIHDWIKCYQKDEVSQIYLALMILSDEQLKLSDEMTAFFKHFLNDELTEIRLREELEGAAKIGNDQLVRFLLEQKLNGCYSLQDKIKALRAAVLYHQQSTILVILECWSTADIKSVCLKAAAEGDHQFLRGLLKEWIGKDGLNHHSFYIEMAEVAAKNNQLLALNLFTVQALKGVLKKPHEPKVQQCLKENIRRVLLHKINNKFPLVPPVDSAWEKFKALFRSKIPTAAEVIAGITPEQKFKWNGLLKMFLYLPASNKPPKPKTPRVAR